MKKTARYYITIIRSYDYNSRSYEYKIDDKDVRAFMEELTQIPLKVAIKKIITDEVLWNKIGYTKVSDAQYIYKELSKALKIRKLKQLYG